MKKSANNGKLIISIYDLTEQWPRHFIDNGYPVICWDKQKEGCILEGFTRLVMMIEEAMEAYPGLVVHGVLAACPCTDYASSGARWMKEKDKPKPGFEPFENSVEMHDALVQIILHLVDLYKPNFWAIENPRGRIANRNPELKPYKNFVFNPSDFGDPYPKETYLYGQFNKKMKYDWVLPLFKEEIHNVAPGKNRANIRSKTPVGFAKAFFEANR